MLLAMEEKRTLARRKRKEKKKKARERKRMPERIAQDYNCLPKGKQRKEYKRWHELGGN